MNNLDLELRFVRRVTTHGDAVYDVFCLNVELGSLLPEPDEDGVTWDFISSDWLDESCREVAEALEADVTGVKRFNNAKRDFRKAFRAVIVQNESFRDTVAMRDKLLRAERDYANSHDVAVALFGFGYQAWIQNADVALVSEQLGEHGTNGFNQARYDNDHRFGSRPEMSDAGEAAAEYSRRLEEEENERENYRYAAQRIAKFANCVPEEVEAKFDILVWHVNEGSMLDVEAANLIMVYLEGKN